MKIADAFGCDIEKLLSLDRMPYHPEWEQNLPGFLKKDILLMKDKRNRKSPVFDCCWDETNSSINVCEAENLISREQADYLRVKYLGMEKD